MPLSDALDRLASLAGIEPGYHDLVGQWHHTSTEAKLALLAAMRIDGGAAEREIARLEALPGDAEGGQRCLTPGELGIGRGWGVTCQVYGLRSARNCGGRGPRGCGGAGRAAGCRGRGFSGAQPLARPVPRGPGAPQPLLPVEPTLVQRALHRGRRRRGASWACLPRAAATPNGCARPTRSTGRRSRSARSRPWCSFGKPSVGSICARARRPRSAKSSGSGAIARRGAGAVLPLPGAGRGGSAPGGPAGAVCRLAGRLALAGRRGRPPLCS